MHAGLILCGRPRALGGRDHTLHAAPPGGGAASRRGSGPARWMGRCCRGRRRTLHALQQPRPRGAHRDHAQRCVPSLLLPPRRAALSLAHAHRWAFEELQQGWVLNPDRQAQQLSWGNKGLCVSTACSHKNRDTAEADPVPAIAPQRREPCHSRRACGSKQHCPDNNGCKQARVQCTGRSCGRRPHRQPCVVPSSSAAASSGWLGTTTATPTLTLTRRWRQTMTTPARTSSRSRRRRQPGGAAGCRCGTHRPRSASPPRIAQCHALGKQRWEAHPCHDAAGSSAC